MMKLTSLCYHLLLIICVLSQPTKQRRKKSGIDNHIKSEVNDFTRIADSGIKSSRNSEKSLELDDSFNMDLKSATSCIIEDVLLQNFESYTQYEKLKILTINSYRHFWRDDLYNSMLCSIEGLSISRIISADDEVAMLNPLLGEISRLKHFIWHDELNIKILPPEKQLSYVYYWEFLGPFPIGKLEMDGDPAFNDIRHDSHMSTSIDPIISHILTSLTNKTYYSELVSNAKVHWRTVYPEGGQVKIQFADVNWNALGQGLGSSAVFEFQGWLRGYAYAKDTASYAIICQGVNTVYIRNDNTTRILVGDVYWSGKAQGIIDLKAGPFALMIPIRGVGQAQVHCTIARKLSSIEAQISHPISSLLQLPSHLGGKSGYGILLSEVFSIIMTNTQSVPITIEFALESNKIIDGIFDVSLAIADKDINIHEMIRKEIRISPGQILAVPLRLNLLSQPVQDSDSSRAQHVLIPCNKKSLLTVVLKPSRGDIVKVPLEMTCRSMDQSILISYLDHDGSVSQSGLIFPPNVTHPTCEDISTCFIPSSYPYILSFHGTGITASNQADAYKVMPEGKDRYEFGVGGFFIFTPSRYGAHNWEAIGELSAQSSLLQIQRLLMQHPNLPQVAIDKGVVAGHSMGGHGAWIAATNHPDPVACVIPTAGWIRKEEYGTSNAFFTLDIQNSYVPLELKLIFEKAMSEFHVDTMISNLLFMDVNIRVGADDITTHPWYSRRMHRILQHHNINSSYTEISDKQHWWWDTVTTNDGGVLNDNDMRNFFSWCHRRLSMDHKQSSCDEHDFIMSVINPSRHHGMCGIRILQQHIMLSLSTISVRKESMISSACSVNADGLTSSDLGCHTETILILKTKNVRKMVIKHKWLSQYDAIIINDATITVPTCFDQQDGSISIVICIPTIASGLLPHVCNPTSSPATIEKYLSNYGPMRHIYARPLVIVYGTSASSSSLRTIMRDYAIYLANSIYIAHHTTVTVISDMEYRALHTRTRSSSYYMLSNVMMIGGPFYNKAMYKYCSSSDIILSNHNAVDGIICKSPVNFYHTSSHSNNNHDHMIVDDTIFSIAHHNFSHHSIIYTFPIMRPTHDHRPYDNDHHNIAMGICVHASTIAQWMHMTRLSWPVIPPMVRAPFANYLPDYVVLDDMIWSEGFGGVVAAGYWNSNWQYDPMQAYIKSG